MAWRAIQDTVPMSESLAQVSDFAERLYWRMLSQTDPWGRLPGSPVKLKAMCVPLLKANDAKIQGALDELVAAGRVEMYAVDETWYCQLVGFDDQQPRDAVGNSRGRFRRRIPEPSRNGSSAGVSGPGRAKTGLGPTEKEKEKEKEELPVPNGTSSASLPTDAAEQAAPPSSSTDAAAVRRLYDHWRSARGKTDPRYDQLSPERRRKIQARLREFSEDELHRAIDAVALDPWEDRPRNDDIVKLFRSRETVDRWLEMAKGKTTPGDRVAQLMAAKGIQ